MKTLLTLLLLVFSLSAVRAQETFELPRDPATHRVNYANVVQVPGVSQAELYTRAKPWFASTFTSAKDVVQADEKDAGIVQGKAWSPIEVHFIGSNRPASQLQLWYTVKLICKEGRYRYEFSDFQVEAPASGNYSAVTTSLEEGLGRFAGMPKQALVFDEYKQEVNYAANGLENRLKTSMAKPATSTSAGKTDW